MPNFATWLYEKSAAGDPKLLALKNFAATTNGWPYWSDKRADFQSLIDKSSLPDKSEIAATLAEQYGEWRAEERASRVPRGIWQWITDNMSGVGLVLFGVFIGSAMFWGLFEPRFYSTLANTEQARGLITFLFVLSTSGIILLIAIAIFWMDERDNIKDRFAYAKDLLTIVIGVLGTIMGFYFGLQASENSVTVSQLTLSRPTATSKDKVTLTGRIVGGKGPYTATLEFTDLVGAVPDAAKMRRDLRSDTGAILHEIDIPQVERPGALFFVLTARDSKSVQAHATGVLTVQPSQPQPPASKQPQPKSKQSK